MRPGLLVRRLWMGRWRWATLLVVLACATTFRLGIWQLDRLAARHAMTARLRARVAQPAFDLTGGSLPGSPDELAFRSVRARGRFDYSAELALGNQVWDGQLGLDLLTPLLLEDGETAVLVDRGWIPAASASPAAWGAYRQADEVVEVDGWVRPVVHRRGRPAAARPDRLVSDLDVQHLAPLVTTLIGRRLVPVVIYQAPSGVSAPPRRRVHEPDLGDGVHLAVAVQWFACSVIIVAGYLALAAQRSTPPRPGPVSPAIGLPAGMRHAGAPAVRSARSGRTR